MEDELRALLQRVGLGLDQVLTRKRFLQWQASDALRLNRAALEELERKRTPNSPCATQAGAH